MTGKQLFLVDSTQLIMYFIDTKTVAAFWIIEKEGDDVAVTRYKANLCKLLLRLL